MSKRKLKKMTTAVLDDVWATTKWWKDEQTGLLCHQAVGVRRQVKQYVTWLLGTKTKHQMRGWTYHLAEEIRLAEYDVTWKAFQALYTAAWEASR